MTGPEHYCEAERLLRLADDNVSMNTVEMTGEKKADVIGAAQVHATLALAASNVNAYHSMDPTRGDLERTDWAQVLS